MVVLNNHSLLGSRSRHCYAIKFQDFKWTICAFTRWDLRPCGGQLQTLKTLPLPGPRLPSKACRVYACYISRAIQPFSARFCCFLLPRSGVEVPAGVGATVMMLSFILNRWQNSEMPRRQFWKIHRSTLRAF